MANDGKLLEGKLQTALQDFMTNKPSFYYRFYDTQSAGNYLPAQPGDFLWLIPGVPAILVEAKSTEAHATLKKLVKPEQRGKHRLWIRSKHLAAFVYADLVKDKMQWITSPSFFNDKKPLPLWEGSLDDASKMLEHIHKLYINGDY